MKSFEYLCLDIFEKLKKPIDDALVDAGLVKDEINEVVLAGGSSRIPKLKSFLKQYFKTNKSINIKRKGDFLASCYTLLKVWN